MKGLGVDTEGLVFLFVCLFFQMLREGRGSCLSGWDAIQGESRVHPLGMVAARFAFCRVAHPHVAARQPLGREARLKVSPCPCCG